MISSLSDDWKTVLSEELVKPYFTDLITKVTLAYNISPNQVFPPKHQLFSAFNSCSFTNVKVVILGQDPYPTKGHLTVHEGKPGSHQGFGWERFTNSVIQRLGARKEPLVFLLWGAHAIAKKSLILGEQHLVLKASHPSPLSAYRGFYGCKHFSQTNEFLQSVGCKPIDW